MTELQFYSNGKLLLSGEYLILDGAKGLAIPTKFGQDLHVESQPTNHLNWISLDKNNRSWFEADFSLADLNLIQLKGDQKVADTLIQILQKAQKINPQFLNQKNGIQVTTHLGFNRNWGLGTSSTLINNIAQWAEIDAFDLLSQSFGGSGYDIACAQNDSSIVYQIENKQPAFRSVNFNPEFTKDLYFVFLNKKQVSSDSIKAYKKKKPFDASLISEVSQLTESILASKSLDDFNRLIFEHELLLSRILNRPTVQQMLFSDFTGQVKSLGAWGGDFVLATGEQARTDYFQRKGYRTVISYNDMIKNPDS